MKYFRTIVLTALLAMSVGSIAAQQIALPDIDFEAFERKALNAVRKLPHDGGMRPGESYNHLYIFAAQFREGVVLHDITNAREFISSLDFMQPSSFVLGQQLMPPTNIYSDYIYDQNGFMRWIYMFGMAAGVTVNATEPHNLLVEVAKQGIEMVFKVLGAKDGLLFGIRRGSVQVLELQLDSTYTTIPFGAYILRKGFAESIVPSLIDCPSNPNARKFTAYLEDGSAIDRSTSLIQFPRFMNADNLTMNLWFAKKIVNLNIILPKQFLCEAILTIDAEGNVTHVELSDRTIDYENSKTVKKIVKTLKDSPRWVPGRVNGEPTEFKYHLIQHFQYGRK